jgi:hypothetical protein
MEYKIDLQPKKCPLCGCTVVHTTNDVIYGKQYGSGYSYICTGCKAFVGTHKSRPQQALGILADTEMRELRKKCHEIFDKTWNTPEERKQRYAELAEKMHMNKEACHFAYFNMELLEKAYKILTK